MRTINNADYYNIVTDETNYERGIEILRHVYQELENTKGDTEYLIPSLTSYLTEETHMEIMALLGFVRTVEDIHEIEIDPSCASIFARHVLLRRMMPLFWARLELDEGELKNEYRKALDGIEYLTTLVPDRLP